MKVQDLDVLRVEPRFIRISGKDIDVSFIPCGITFDIDDIIQQLGKLDPELASKGGAETKKAFELSIQLCAIFCSHKYPELDLEWWNNNADALQVKTFAEAVKEALQRAYAGVGSPAKKPTASRKKQSQ